MPAPFKYKQLDKKFLNLFFILYIFISIFNVIHHEPYRDEAQAWLIARDVPFFKIINLGYDEGTPMLWHYILAPLAKLQFPYITINILSIVIAIATIYLLFYKLSLPIWLKISFAFSYYMLYQLNIIARQYCLGIFFLFLVAYFYKDRFKKPIWYATFIFLLGNTSLYTFFFSLGFTIIYFLELIIIFLKKQRNLLEKLKNKRKLFLVTAILIFNLVFVTIQLSPSKNSRGYHYHQYQGRTLSLKLLPSFLVEWNYKRALLYLKETFKRAYFYSKPNLRGLPPNIKEIVLRAYFEWGGNSIIQTIIKITIFCLFLTFLIGNYFTFIVVLISYGLLTFFGNLLNLPFGLRHHALYLSLFVVCLGIVRQYPRYLLPQSILNKLPNFSAKIPRYAFTISTTLLCFYFFMTTPFGLGNIIKDKNVNFSGGKEMANYLKKSSLLNSNSIIVSTHPPHTSSVLPYFKDLKFFYTYGEGEYGTYVKWNLFYNQEKYFFDYEILKQNNILLLSDAPLENNFTNENELKKYKLLYHVQNISKTNHEILYLYQKIN